MVNSREAARCSHSKIKREDVSCATEARGQSDRVKEAGDAYTRECGWHRERDQMYREVQTGTVCKPIEVSAAAGTWRRTQSCMALRRLLALRLACRPRPMHFSRCGANRPAATLRPQLGHATCGQSGGGCAWADLGALGSGLVGAELPPTSTAPAACRCVRTGPPLHAAAAVAAHLIERYGRHHIAKHINHAALCHRRRQRRHRRRLAAAAVC